MNRESDVRHPGGPVQKRFFFGLRSKMLIYFGVLFALAIVVLKWAEFYGIPFTAFHGEYRIWRSEVFKGLNLVADLKKERLLRWIEERRDDASILAESRILCSQVAELSAIVKSLSENRRLSGAKPVSKPGSWTGSEENVASGIKSNELWAVVKREKTYQRLIQHLSLVKGGHGIYEKIKIADANGTIIASTRDTDLGVDISRENIFTNALNPNYSEAIGIEKVPYSRGKFALFISRAIKAVGEVNSADRPDEALAVLIMHINPEDLIKPMLHIGEGLGETGEALLVNQDMEIITSLKHSLVDGTTAHPLEYQIKATPVVFAAFGEEGITAARDYRGISVLAAFRHIRISPELGWGIVLKRDEAEVFGPLRRSTFYGFLVGLIGILSVLGLAYIIAAGLSRPIRFLNRAVQRVESGDLSARVPIVRSTSDEVGILTTAFNSMIQRLQRWYEELEARTAELSKSNEELTREIVERKRAEEARERLNRELIGKNKELEQVVYVASHDLRSPLVNIQGFSKELDYTLEQVRSILSREDIPSAAKQELTPVMEEDIPEAIQFILTSVSKMDSLLTGLLRLSRLGRAALTFEKLDMNKLMSDIADAFKFQIREADVTLQIDELSSCRGDAGQINQLFSNLLDNALKYRNSHGDDIIRISGREEAGQVVYCVEDNGMGIAVEHQSKIFEIFHRLNPSVGSGEGLGLTIARRILDRHNGKIWVESEPGKGSKFFVSLPIIPFVVSDETF